MTEQNTPLTEQAAPFHILWIEDEILAIAASVDEVKRVLKKSDHIGRPVEIGRAEWVTKAEAEFQRLKDAPADLIILDLMLPRTEDAFEADPPRIDANAGFMIWHRLRKQQEWGAKLANVPILVLTALSRPLFRPMMEQEDHLKWLDKPVMPSTIAKEITSLVRLSHQSCQPE